eukprot:scaffold28254_cov97-Skeletonema_dohrnii-CCMP3373.AAC.1
MKSFALFISAAIVASAAAINEPVASPTDAIERELAEYERQLGTDVTGSPTATPGRPTGGVSLLLYIRGGRLVLPLMDGNMNTSCAQRPSPSFFICETSSAERRLAVKRATRSEDGPNVNACGAVILNLRWNLAPRRNISCAHIYVAPLDRCPSCSCSSMAVHSVSYSYSYGSGKSGKGSKASTKGSKGSGSSKGGKGDSMSYGSYSSSYSSGKSGKGSSKGGKGSSKGGKGDSMSYGSYSSSYSSGKSGKGSSKGSKGSSSKGSKGGSVSMSYGSYSSSYASSGKAGKRN